jgi:cytochrome P450
MRGVSTVSRSKRARPPGPRNVRPFLGVLPHFRRDPAGYLLSVAREYGDLAHMRLGPQHAYVVSRPDWIRDVLVTNQNNFTKSRMLERAKVLLGDGLLTSEGEFHTRQRRLVQPAFHRDRLVRYAADMVSCAKKLCSQWHDGAELDMHREMTHLRSLSWAARYSVLTFRPMPTKSVPP